MTQQVDIIVPENLPDIIVRQGCGHMHVYSDFERLFGRSLDDFWIDNSRGLDIAKFDAELVHAGNRPLLKVVREKWGAEGATMVALLLPVPPKKGKKRKKKVSLSEFCI